MKKEIIVLTSNTLCDQCGGPIKTGDTGYALYHSNADDTSVSLEAIKTEWILTFCAACGTETGESD